MKCEKCGVEYEGNYCPKGCNSPYFKQKKPIASWLIVVLLILFFPVGIILMWTNCSWKKSAKVCISIFFAIVFFSAFGSSPENTDSGSASSNVTVGSQSQETTINDSNSESSVPEKSSEEIKEEYISDCEAVIYKTIARNPAEYENKKIKFTGKIMQVSEPIFGSSTTYLMQVTKGEYGLWEDIVYVTYKVDDSEAKILKDDIVTFYGVCKGDYSYKTVLGSSSTVPRLDAQYVDIINEG